MGVQLDFDVPTSFLHLQLFNYVLNIPPFLKRDNRLFMIKRKRTVRIERDKGLMKQKEVEGREPRQSFLGHSSRWRRLGCGSGGKREAMQHTF